jgi:hypothetical protein
MLASIHRGDAFTTAFSFILAAFAGIFGVLSVLAWLFSWGHVYYEFERWQLVVAFADQFFLLGLILVVLHVTYLRASHLRSIPPGDFVILRATTLILRWLGECVLILTLGALVHALLRVPESGWLSSLLGPGSAAEGDFMTGVKLLKVLSTGWLQLVGFFIFMCLYALAGALETVLAIERNTRRQEPTGLASGEVASRGRELGTGRESAPMSF